MNDISKKFIPRRTTFIFGPLTSLTKIEDEVGAEEATSVEAATKHHDCRRTIFVGHPRSIAVCVFEQRIRVTGGTNEARAAPGKSTEHIALDID
jgi:hypothetical protein